MIRLIEAGNLPQLGAFCCQGLFDLLIVFDIYEIGRHYLPPA